MTEMEEQRRMAEEVVAEALSRPVRKGNEFVWEPDRGIAPQVVRALSAKGLLRTPGTVEMPSASEMRFEKQDRRQDAGRSHRTGAGPHPMTTPTEDPRPKIDWLAWDKDPWCLNGWDGCEQHYTGGHYCNKSYLHPGRCVCDCGATTSQSAPTIGESRA